MTDSSNSSAPPVIDPLTISTEVYLLDALLQHAQAVANQFGFRWRMDLVARFSQALHPLAVFRAQVDAETRSGLVLAGPGDLPRANG